MDERASHIIKAATILEAADLIKGIDHRVTSFGSKQDIGWNQALKEAETVLRMHAIEILENGEKL